MLVILASQSQVDSLKRTLNEEMSARIEAESKLEKLTKLSQEMSDKIYHIHQELKAVTLERDEAQAKLYRLELLS